MRGRDFRRAKRDKYRKRAFRVLKYSWGYSNFMNDEDIRDKARHLANNLAVCSCYACRNQRHNPWISNEEKLTIQERKAKSL